jgi:hypothetical protein
MAQSPDRGISVPDLLGTEVDTMASRKTLAPQAAAASPRLCLNGVSGPKKKNVFYKEKFLKKGKSDYFL